MSISQITATISSSLFLSGLVILPTVIYQFAYLDQIRDRVRFGRSSSNEEIFDFVIVGAGSSGSVLANRLSAHHSVLLLEAGGDPFPLMMVPAMAPLFLTHPIYDWAYRTLPQNKSCQSLKNKESLWLKGRGLGGTSLLNFMIYIRGHPLDYDNWAGITGDTRWTYQNLIPYFKKSEHYHPDPNEIYDENYHSITGELHVEKSSYRALSPYFLNAAREFGYSVIDVNAPYSEGFSNVSFNAKNGRRWSTYSAFLEGIAEKGHKIKIAKYATATKVLLKNKNNQAYGVEYVRHGQIRRAIARNEIILSAGAIGSPQLLLLSGIGPSQQLQKLGIQAKVNLPVGQNLQDHVIALVGPFTTKEKLTYVPDRDGTPRDILKFFQDGSGPLTSTGIEALGLISSTFAKAETTNRTWPDLELILMVQPLHSQGAELLSRIFNIRSDVAKEYYRGVLGKDSFHIMSLLSRPKSRGEVRLRTSDYKDPPIIDPRYLEEPQDVEIILEGVKRIMKLVEGTKAFRQIGAKLSPIPFPSCKGHKFKSDDYWRCYIKEYTLSVYHPTGTCGMGKIGSSNAVLDSNLRVIGTKNLRVIDASAQPQIVGVNTHASSIMLGEVGADLIKKMWT